MTGLAEATSSLENRICYFSVPRDLASFYREFVYQLAEEAGFVPSAAEDLVLPGESLLAAISALVARADMLVIDVGGGDSRALNELSLAAGRADAPYIVAVIVEEAAQVLRDVSGVYTTVYRGISPYNNIEQLVLRFSEIFESATSRLEERISSEPQRLLAKGEPRAALLAAYALLEVTVRDVAYETAHMVFLAPPPQAVLVARFRNVERALEFLEETTPERTDVLERFRRWRRLRNQIAHGIEPVRDSDALHATNEILEYVAPLRASLQ